MTTEDDRSCEDEIARLVLHPIVQRLSSRLKEFEAHDAPITEGVRLAAVTALVRIVEAEAELLLIKRAVVEGDPWSGHIAFPGGRYDVGDESLAKTALRETREELAIDVERDGILLGRLDDLAPRSPRLPPIIVRPFVAVVRADVAITVNREVASAFWVPVRVLMAPESQAEYVMKTLEESARFPAYRVNEHVVWGLTERMLAQLLPLFN